MRAGILIDAKRTPEARPTHRSINLYPPNPRHRRAAPPESCHRGDHGSTHRRRPLNRGYGYRPREIIAGAETLNLGKFFDSIIEASDWNYTLWHPLVLGSGFILGGLFLSGSSLLTLRLVIAAHFVADFGIAAGAR